jgi:hypothetical protein
LKNISPQCWPRAGRPIAQAVSRRFPTAAAWVRDRVWSSGICGGRSGAGAGLLRVLRFPFPIFIPPNSPSSQSPGASTIGHYVADVPSGPSLDSTPHYANLTNFWPRAGKFNLLVNELRPRVSKLRLMLISVHSDSAKKTKSQGVRAQRGHNIIEAAG